MTWPWLRLSMIYCCAQRLWSQIRVTCQRCRFRDSADLSCCAGASCLRRVMAAYVRVGYRAFRQPKFECGCCEMLVFRVCGVRQNLVFNLHRNPDRDDRIFDWLLATMAAVPAEDVRASILFVGNLNGHHQECLGSTTTNRCSLWLRNCLRLRSAGCRLNPCM